MIVGLQSNQRSGRTPGADPHTLIIHPSCSPQFSISAVERLPSPSLVCTSSEREVLHWNFAETWRDGNPIGRHPRESGIRAGRSLPGGEGSESEGEGVQCARPRRQFIAEAGEGVVVVPFEKRGEEKKRSESIMANGNGPATTRCRSAFRQRKAQVRYARSQRKGAKGQGI